MIKWLRDKFSSLISFFFVLSVIGDTISGGILGYIVGSKFEYYYKVRDCIIGSVVGLILGILIGILIFGFIATILNISETNDIISKTLKEIQNSAPNLQNSNNSLNETNSSSPIQSEQNENNNSNEEKLSSPAKSELRLFWESL